MGFYPFGWTWKTRSGGQVKLFGVLITLPLLGGSWFWARRAPSGRDTPSLPQSKQLRVDERGIDGDIALERR